MAIPDEGAVLGTGHNYSLFLKRLFLGFTQALFARHSKYTWRLNLSDTDIVIVDKYAINLKTIEKKPAIVLERGGFNWMYTSIAQRQNKSLLNQTESYTDLIKGSIRFNCYAKTGLVAEELAVILLQALTGYKKEIRAKGIHQIHDISIGEEVILKQDSDIELTTVPVVLVYTTQKMLSSTTDFYSIYVVLTNNDSTTILLENSDYFVRQNILTLTTAPPAGSSLNVMYLDATTLAEVTETPTPTPNGLITEFTLANAVYGYGPILECFSISTSGQEITSYDYEEITVTGQWFDVDDNEVYT